MGRRVQLVCLANSRKGGDRCIAGMELGTKNWIRPISRRFSEAVSEVERRYSDGAEPRVLDVVSMRLSGTKPDGFQCENWLLDPVVQWEREGRINWGELCRLEQRPSGLWINGYHSWGGVNNKIPTTREDEVSDSLNLIRVDSVDIKRVESKLFAHFEYMGTDYALNVTDPRYEETATAGGLARRRLGESFITVSLGKDWHGYLYKFAAAIIERKNTDSGGGR
ncbi:dual OB domain-containing protein [Streptomyces mutabilis]|uniref:dual OB domain-containing protein n=1 Tax=Streptomyces mutabilis TaxID=67332 RepID=UPI003F6981C6